MTWLLAIWVIVALLVVWAYWKAGFKNASQIIESYRAASDRQDGVSNSGEENHRAVG